MWALDFRLWSFVIFPIPPLFVIRESGRNRSFGFCPPTMSWPLASHFSAMLQNPHVAFRDPRLQRAVIEKNEQNQPRPWAGAFAVSIRGSMLSQTPFAVRIFTTESPERRERYDLISAYLRGRKLNCLVDFEYRDRSIRSAGDGKWYPLIIMDWVQGETLFNWLRPVRWKAIATPSPPWPTVGWKRSRNSATTPSPTAICNMPT